MHLQTLLPILSAIGTTSATIASKPAHLWATHYNGNVYSLTLKNNNLSLAQTLNTCGDMPSWLTLDAHTRTVYCSDESGTADASTHGSLTALHVKPDGTLREGAVAKTVGGGVNSVIYESDAGKKFIAIAH